MSSIGKFAVFDDRMVQAAPEYAVFKGGEAVTATAFRAISANQSQHTFNVQAPSPNVFLDRAPDWVSDVMLSFIVDVGVGGGQSGVTAANAGTSPVITIGKDFALSAFPLHQMTGTMVASINDVICSMNTAEILPQILRMVDYKANLKQKTCPSMLDTYANYNDGYGSLTTPLGSYFESIIGNYCTNGAYGRIQFCDPTTGAPLLTQGGAGGNPVGTGSYTFGAATVYYNGGIPQCATTNVPDGGGDWVVNPSIAAMPIGLLFTSAEKLVLSPFIFADSKEMSTGIFGLNAFQLTCNMVSNSGLQRVIRSTNANFRSIVAGSVAFVAGGFANSILNVEFITPSLSIPLPPISSVPWMEFARYTSSFSINPSQTTSVTSNSFLLSGMPDYLMIFAKPQQGAYGVNDADYLFPISNISMNFNSFAGLMSTMTIEQLYHMSIQNGLEADFNLFTGKARVAPANGLNTLTARGVNLCGCPLIIKPGKDFALSQGIASGVGGNYSLQFNISVTNNSPTTFTNNAMVYVIAINSGFFESHGGSSRIIRTPLNEADVISTTAVNPMGKQRMERLVGGGFFDKIGSMISKAHHIYGQTKPFISGIKNMLPDGKIKDVLHSVGYGRHQGMQNRLVNAE
jgi:hypothetical protein